MVDAVIEFITNNSFGDFMVEQIRNASEFLITMKASGLTKAVKPLINSLLILSVVIYALRVIFGDQISTLRDLVTTGIWVIVGIGITSSSPFEHLVYNPYFATKDSLTAWLMIGDSSQTIYSAFSDANYRMFAHAANILDKAGMTDFSMWINALAIYIIFGIYYVIFLAVTLFCELASNLVMLLGMLIIPLAAFKSARGLFKSWALALAKYFGLFVIIGFIVSIMNILTDTLITSLMNEIYVARGGGMDSSQVKLDSPILGATLAAGAFGIYLTYQALELAGELTGSVMGDGKAGVTALANSASAAASASKYSGASFAAGKLSSGAGAAFTAAKNKFLG